MRWFMQTPYVLVRYFSRSPLSGGQQTQTQTEVVGSVITVEDYCSDSPLGCDVDPNMPPDDVSDASMRSSAAVRLRALIDDLAHPDDVSVPSAIPSLSGDDSPRRRSRSPSIGDTGALVTGRKGVQTKDKIRLSS